MNQTQKYLRESETPDFLAAKQSKIMNFCS